ncbi:MAG: carboxylating nicotinate-nucleotide diphosphorylase [Candidatus Gastranaerophilales bacterium]|nr:carboxylating nicotinate-nucleotide diphosphorylase [Candidatus Gastranaerophilales bacterium]
MVFLLHDFIIEEHIKQALKEDIGFGDISTDYIEADGKTLKATMNSREEGVLCGIGVVKKVFEILDPMIQVTTFLKDGDKISKGQDIAIIEGNARAVLTGERLALNYVQRMSAIATLTNQYVQVLEPYKATITETRKTTPNFRLFEKYAVTVGGATPHRFSLCDCVMLKDNHIALCGGITQAVATVRKHISHTHKIEVETDTLEQVKEAAEAGADIIMLDNMSPDTMRKAIDIIKGRAIVEASGQVNIKTLEDIAKTGVDVISTSAITAKAGSLDIGLDIK